LAIAILIVIQVFVDTYAARPAIVKPIILPVWLICSVGFFIGSVICALVRRERHYWLTIVGVATTLSIAACIISQA
jgi:hypothetical protein